MTGANWIDRANSPTLIQFFQFFKSHNSMRVIRKHRFKQDRSVLQQVLSFGAGEGLARALNWGMMSLLPFFLSTEEYGKVGLIISIEMVASNMSLIGLDRAILRYHAKDEWPDKLLKSALVLWACFAWIPLGVVIVLYWMDMVTFFGVPIAPHLFLTSIVIAVFNLNFLCICIGRAKCNLKIFLRFRILNIAIKFSCVIALAKIFGVSICYVWGACISSLVMLFFIFPFLHKNVEGNVDQVIIGRLLIFGWPFVFHVLSGNILSYFSRFFLESFSSTKDVGLFTFAFTVGSALYMGYSILSTYFEPRIYSYSCDKLNCEKWLTFYTYACIILSSAGGACLLVIYPYLTPHLHPDYGNALPTISMVMGTVLLTPLYLQGIYRLTSYGRTGYIATVSFLAASISVMLNSVLIPAYGIMGAAIALYVANFFLCLSILITSLYLADIRMSLQYSVSVYLPCVFGSLSAFFWANETGFVIWALFSVFLINSWILSRYLYNNEPFAK